MTDLVGLGLICGHLVGDYLLQSDWMASNKGKPWFDVEKAWSEVDYITVEGEIDESGNLIKYGKGTLRYELALFENKVAQRRQYNQAHLACFVHCLLYTIAVWAFSGWWMPWWGVLVCFTTHFAIDRYALARRWMECTSWACNFASKEHPCWPWSIIVVDNTLHIVTLFLIGIAS